MSSKPSSSQLAKHNLAICLLALQEMRNSYISADAAYNLFDRARIMVEKTLREAEVVSREPTMLPETHGIRTTQWLDGSEGYDFASTGILPALWTPFAEFMPGDIPEITPRLGSDEVDVLMRLGLAQRFPNSE